MNATDQLRFAVNDRIDNMDVTPSHVSLALLGEFQKDVSTFLKGSTNDVNPSDVIVSVEEGSLSLLATGAILITASTLWSDLEHLKNTNSLNFIDSKRAKIIEEWQSKSKKNPNRRYSVINQAAGISFKVDSKSEFYRSEDTWIDIEKYLYGTVIDMGGKNRANVHIELENGDTVIVTSTPEFLSSENKNRIYHPASLHVMAEENLITGKLRNYRLLGFSDYQPSYNDDEFNLMVEKGTNAWAGIGDTTEWLNDLRGNHR